MFPNKQCLLWSIQKIDSINFLYEKQKSLNMYSYSYYPSLKRRIITKTSSIHKVLENLFQRIQFFDYSEDNYIYSTIRIIGQANTLLEMSYIHYKSIDELPRTEIIMSNPQRVIRYYITHSDEIQIQYNSESI